MNPRPNMRARSLYRFSGARWLSGPGGSTTSVGSVFRWKSRGRIGHHPQQALVSDRNPARSERHSPVSVFPRLRSESKLTIIFGSYRFCLFRGQATSPAAQVHVHTRRSQYTPCNIRDCDANNHVHHEYTQVQEKSQGKELKCPKKFLVGFIPPPRITP